jgi:alpha-N-arabinofuranosidase
MIEQLILVIQPNLVDFNNNPDGVVRSTSYYVHELFFHNVGDTVVRVDADKSFGPGAFGVS